MLLHVLRRPKGALLCVSPLLLIGAAIPGGGLLLLLGLALAIWGTGQTAFLVFLAFFFFLFAVMAYAFWSAASTRTVRCGRAGQRVFVVKRGERHEASASELSIELTRRKVGMQGPVTVHEVSLASPELNEPVTLHSGLTRWGAEQAAKRVRQHLGVD